MRRLLPFLPLILTCLAAGFLSSCSTTSSEKDSSVSVPQKSSYLPGRASATVIAKSRNLPKDKHGMPTYKDLSEKTRYVRTTAYSHKENEKGASGRKNAIGSILKYGQVRSAAADWSRYPLGTKFKIKGQNYTYQIDDYGSALVGTNTIDIFKPSLKSMRAWGTRKTEITVTKWGSFARSARILKGRRRFHFCNRMFRGCQHRVNNGAL